VGGLIEGAPFLCRTEKGEAGINKKENWAGPSSNRFKLTRKRKRANEQTCCLVTSVEKKKKGVERTIVGWIFPEKELLPIRGRKGKEKTNGGVKSPPIDCRKRKKGMGFASGGSGGR